MKRRRYLSTLAFPALAASGGCLASGSFGDGAAGSGRATDDGPRFDPHAERVVPSGDGSGPVALDAEGERFVVVADDDTVDSFAFVLRNGSSSPFAPDRWLLMRGAADGWARAAAGASDAATVEPGASHAWSLSLDPHPTPRGSGTSFVVPPDPIPDGTYAFAVVGTLGTGGGGTRIEAHARFDLARATEAI